MAKQIEMPPELKSHLENKMIGTEINGMRIKQLRGSGNTAATYEVEDEFGIPWALKLVTRDSYGDKAPLREIVRFANTVDNRFLVFPIAIGDWPLKLKNTTYKFIWFKSRCVKGETLEDFIESGVQFSAKHEIERYMTNLTAALEELRRLGYSHGDLHNRNIMREVIGEDGPLPEIRYVIIDFSEAHPIDATQEGLLKDIEMFGRHLRSFYDAVYQRGTPTREEMRVLTAIEHIPGLLNGISPESMGISRASQILERFNIGLISVEETTHKLVDPFHPLSAEDIGSDVLLTDLCLIQMWWISELERSSNVLLIGPRGCGKTMAFRRLRLKTKIKAKKTEEIRADRYIGFYLPCESVFYMRFSDFSEIDIESNKDSLVLYFNMAILTEVLSTLAVLPEFLGPVSKQAIQSFSKLLQEEIGTLWEELHFPSLVTSLGELTDFAGILLRHIRKSIAYGHYIDARGSTDFIARLVELVKRGIPSLGERYFIFFLDDYTQERVPFKLQEALHPIVSQRSSDVCFKISAHMFGSIYCQPRPLAHDEGRNIQIINLGTVYLQRKRNRVEGKLLLRILNERFKHCEGYNGTIEEWLGKTTYPGGKTLSHALHDEYSRSKTHYHGIECLMNLCTGDFSEMIRIVGEIFREAGIEKDAPVQLIPAYVQDRVIRAVSREFLGRVRHIRPDGQKLYDVLSNFGTLSQRLLYQRGLVKQGTDSKGRVRMDPYDVLTVYIDNLPAASRVAKVVWERLQVASIFVDVGLAPSQRTVIADRATMRRIYCPAFSTTLTSSEHMQLTKDRFELFMDKPKEFCTDYFQRRPAQQPLWSDQGTQEAEEVGISVGAALEIDDKYKVDFTSKVSGNWIKTVNTLPPVIPLEQTIGKDVHFDLYIGAFGFEERTANAATLLAHSGIRAENAIMVEFDMYYDANSERRHNYEKAISQLTGGKPYRPILAAVGVQDPYFQERLNDLLKTLAKTNATRILFDITSCPSIVLANSLRVLLEYPCHLTILYSEAAEYFPTLGEWESGKLRPSDKRVQPPFMGVRFVTKPPILQSDDLAELPVLLVLFPTFNTERTDGVLAELDPVKRIWLFGEPHDLKKNSYRINMAKSFAAPIMYEGDTWSMVSTFQYTECLLALAGIYSEHRFRYRIAIMPHGSKMQTLAVSLFAITHEASLVFATPKTYIPNRYSKGCIQVWGITLGETKHLINRLRSERALGNE